MRPLTRARALVSAFPPPSQCWAPLPRAAVAAPRPPAPKPVTPPALAPTPYQWRTFRDDPGRAYLYKGKLQVGGYDLETHQYRPLSADGTWGDPCEPPLAPPCFGLDLSKLPAEEKYTLNGREVPREAALEAIEKGVVDDSHKLRVSVLGGEKVRKEVADELRRQLQAEDFAVRHYDPAAWELRTGHQVKGEPTIYCQAPSGKVLHRQDDYQGGPGPAVAALRKARSYDPSKDPDLRRPQLVPGLSLHPLLLALGGLALVLYLRKDDAHATR